MRQTLQKIPAGEAGTDATIRRMSQLVDSSLQKGQIRLLALQILSSHHVQDRDSLAAAKAIYLYVVRKVRYIPDPIGLETIQQPEISIRLKAGDCDDHATLVGALAHSIGIPARFRVVGASRDSFSHIFPELFIDGVWYPADTTNPAGFGKRPGRFPAEKIYSVIGGRVMPRLSAAPRTTRIPTRLLARAAYGGAMSVMVRNWRQGKINRDDLVGYLQTIDQGNGPGRFTFAEPAMRQAIADLIARVDSTGSVSGKPPGQLNGLEGLDGFLSSVWKGVRGAVGAVVPGGGAVIGAAGSIIGGGGLDPNEGAQYGHSPAAWTALGSHERELVRNFKWQGRADSPAYVALLRSVPPGTSAGAAARFAHETTVSRGGLPAPAPASSGFTFAPNVNLPPGLVSANVSPEAARAGAMEFTSGMTLPIIFGVVGAAAFFLLRK